MKGLLVLFAVLIGFAPEANAQLTDRDGFATEGGLGTTRVVDNFQVSRSTLDAILEDHTVAQMVVQVEAGILKAAEGFALYASRATDGQADCTDARVTCLIAELRGDTIIRINP